VAVVRQHGGSLGDIGRGMKDTTSTSATELGDAGGGSNSDGGGGGTTRSNSPGSPDMNGLSPPCSSNSLAIATAAAAAFSAGLHHGTPEGISPLLTHNQMFRNAPTAESLLAASQTAALMAATAVGGSPLRLPVSLHTSLASGPALFHHQRGGGIFNWSSSSASPPPVVTTDSSNNNNRMAVKTTLAKRNNHHVVSSSSAAVTRKNQANARKRSSRKVDPVEPTIIEVAAMTQIAAAPPSPPTSGSHAHVQDMVFTKARHWTLS